MKASFVMQQKNKIKRQNLGNFPFSRRYFLQFSTVLVGASFFPAILAQAVVNKQTLKQAATSLSAELPEPESFQADSRFLTGQEILPQLAARAWSALTNHDASFAEKYAELHAFLRKSGAETIDALKEEAVFRGTVRATAMAVISAYYLGYVGTPRALHAHDDTIFISFREALMYRPTYHAVPLPTYSRWESGFWSRPVEIDQG